MTDFELLQQYAVAGSQDAFAQLVHRHIDWVYNVCRQQVRDPDLAEDVTQAVFLTLAGKASTLRETTSISGWLFLTSRYAATSALKIEQRRRRHERQAANMKHEATQSHADESPQEEIDAALAKLKAADREALILRFFRGLTHQSIADILGISEEAAQKRVNRALDRLRKALGPTAAMFMAAPIAAVLSQRAMQTSPPDLAARSLIAVKTGGSANAQAIMNGMAAMKRVFATKIAMIAITPVLIAGIAIVLAVETRSSGPAQTIQTVGKYDLSAVQVFRVTGTPQDGMRWTDYYSRQNAVVHELSAVVQIPSDVSWSANHYILDQTEWDYRDNGKLIFRKMPLRPALPQLRKIESDLSLLQGAKATRQPTLDETIDGAPCQAYHLADNPGQSLNTFVYVDAITGRPARIKSDKPALDITVAYDPPLPADFFKVPAKPGFETLDARDYFEKKYPLKGALFTREGVGQIFAVHEATQDLAGCFHVICSCRLKPAVRTALSDLPDDQSVGKFMMDKHANFPFHYIKIAELYESGMQVSYLLAIPKKPLAPNDICQLPVTMASSDEVFLRGHATRGSGKGRDVHFPVSIKVKLQPDAPTARQFAGRAYDEAAPLVGMLAGQWIIGPGGLPDRETSLTEVDREMAKYLTPDGNTQH